MNDKARLEVEAQLGRIAKALRKLERETVFAVLKSGKLLEEAQSVLSGVGRGSQFGSWVRNNCSFTKRAALYRIDAFFYFDPERTGLSRNVVGRFAPTAMYRLAKAARAKQEAIALAKAGQRITAKLAGELLAKHRGNVKSKDDGIPDRIISAVRRELPDISPSRLLGMMSDAYGWWGIDSQHRNVAAEISLDYPKSKQLAQWQTYCEQQRNQFPHVADDPRQIPRATIESFRHCLAESKKFGEYQELLEEREVISHGH